jgi:hypothetical protein
MGIECCLSGVAMANGLENRKLEARVALVVRGFAARMRLGEMLGGMRSQFWACGGRNGFRVRSSE